MALTATCIHRVRPSGSDSVNGGIFDPGQTAGMLTDGAATSATGTAPVFSSASYNFVAGDVGAWVYIASGTNWTPGWYKIASVATNVATLEGTAGLATLANKSVTTANGCATTASPTGATWTIDYSNQDTAQFSVSDITYVTGTTFTSATINFGKQMVGNVVRITGGTNFTTGYYIITSVTGTTATFNATACSGASSNGAGGLGGAFATPGYCSSLIIAGNVAFVKGGTTYTTTSASANVAGGSVGFTTDGEMAGYTTTPGDNGQFTIKCGVGVGAALFSGNANKVLRNIIADGNNETNSKGSTSACTHINVRCVNMYYESFQASTSLYIDCSVASPRSGQPCSDCSNSTFIRCVMTGSTGSAFKGNSYQAYDCIAYGNSVGFELGYDGLIENCTAYNNTSHGINLTNSRRQQVRNSVLVSNGGYGITASSNLGPTAAYNCAFYNNTSGQTQNLNNRAPVTLSGDPFTNAAGTDFSPDSTSGEGAALRGLSLPLSLPNVSSNNYRDIGAVQHQDSGGGGGLAMSVSGPA